MTQPSLEASKAVERIIDYLKPYPGLLGLLPMEAPFRWAEIIDQEMNSDRDELLAALELAVKHTHHVKPFRLDIFERDLESIHGVIRKAKESK